MIFSLNFLFQSVRLKNFVFSFIHFIKVFYTVCM